MRKIKFVALLLVASSFAFTSCGKDDEKKGNSNVKTITLETTATGSQSDPTTQTSNFIKFSFKEGKIVTSDDWDFAVRGRLFITNGRSKYGKDAGLIFGKSEPKRTKNVKVISVIGEFEKEKTIGGFVGTDWHMDYDYARGNQDPLAPAISFESSTENSSMSRQPWHLRAGKGGDKIMVLRPVVFIFQTQDGHFAKMAIEKMVRTNSDFDKKEEITYKLKYYYNPKKGNPSLDENK